MLENVVSKKEADTEKIAKIVTFFPGTALHYYFDTFPCDNYPVENRKDYNKVKEAMIEQFSPKTTQEIVMNNAVNMHYQGGNVNMFIERANRCNQRANFNKESQPGVLPQSV